MPQIQPQEFERLPLRVHDFLAGVPLHDVWAVDLPRMRSGITLDEFLTASGGLPFKPSPVVRALLNIRFTVGRLFGWDREPGANAREYFAARLTAEDLSRSLAPAGKREGPFRMVYRFENEQLLEADQPYGTRRSVQRARRNRKCLSFLLRGLRTERRPPDSAVHGANRSVPQTDRLPVDPA